MDTGKLTLFLLGIVILMLAFVAASVLGFKPCTGQCGGSSITGQTGGTAYYAPNETGRTIQTSGGNVLDVSQALGRPSTYVDTSGRNRNLTCYQMEYCVECPQCEQCNQCAQEGSQCGYGRTPLTNLVANAPFYGDCCDGLQCTNGQCARNQCVQNGQLCGYGPTGGRSIMPYNPGTYNTITGAGAGTTIAGAPSTAGTTTATSNYNSVYRPTYYGDCCGNSQCIEGYCTPPQQQCVEQGQTCGYGLGALPTSLVPTNYTNHGQCCDNMACIQGTCQPPTQCNERGQFCGYGPQTFTTNYQNPTYYGGCCGDDQCLNGYCSPPAQNCVNTGGTCGYGTTYTMVAPPPTANYYGTCCEGDYCSMGRCTPNQGCSEQGGTCAAGQISCCEGLECKGTTCVKPCTLAGDKCTYDADCCAGYCLGGVCSTQCIGTEGSACIPGVRDCCSGMACSDGHCGSTCSKSGSCTSNSDCCDNYACTNGRCTEVVTPGCQTSGSCAVGASVCCAGYYCNDNLVCTPESACTTSGPCTTASDCCTGYVCGQSLYCQKEGGSTACTDSDGSNYYTAGHASGNYESVYGTYYDYCLDTGHVVEYTCAASANEVVATTITCPAGCVDGACLMP